MQDYLTFLITPLLSHPDQLQITVQPGSISIQVGPDDTGRVIGKHGLVINSLRTLLKTYCHLHQLPFVTLTLTAPSIADFKTASFIKTSEVLNSDIQASAAGGLQNAGATQVLK